MITHFLGQFQLKWAQCNLHYLYDFFSHSIFFEKLRILKTQIILSFVDIWIAILSQEQFPLKLGNCHKFGKCLSFQLENSHLFLLTFYPLLDSCCLDHWIKTHFLGHFQPKLGNFPHSEICNDFYF